MPPSRGSAARGPPGAPRVAGGGGQGARARRRLLRVADDEDHLALSRDADALAAAAGAPLRGRRGSGAGAVGCCAGGSRENERRAGAGGNERGRRRRTEAGGVFWELDDAAHLCDGHARRVESDARAVGERRAPAGRLRRDRGAHVESRAQRGTPRGIITSFSTTVSRSRRCCGEPNLPPCAARGAFGPAHGAGTLRGQMRTVKQSAAKGRRRFAGALPPAPRGCTRSVAFQPGIRTVEAEGLPVTTRTRTTMARRSAQRLRSSRGVVYSLLTWTSLKVSQAPPHKRKRGTGRTADHEALLERAQ